VEDDDFIDACRDLREVFAANAAEGERLRSMPPSVVEAVLDADLVRSLVARSLGGHGLSLGAFCEGVRELAKGCPASAWTTSFLTLHPWMLTKFPPEGQAVLFESGMPLATAPLAPSGTLRPTDGGYVVRGRWEWATAVNHADWCIVHGIDQSVDFGTRFAVLPVTSVTVEDTWHTSGMRATGSNVVVVDDVHVPTAMTCAGDDLREARRAAADDGLASLPLLSVLALVASAPAVGAAEAATELYEARLRERVLSYSLGDRAADQPLAQARLAAVTSSLATLLAGWRSAIAELEHSDSPDDLLRVRTRLAAAAAVRSSRLLLGEIGEGAGASVYASSHPLQRLQRDVETLKGHAVFDWDRTTELAGRVMLGPSLGPTDMA
jgi:alkylation response protein AidB-like acyl-CoA dehydrogenase